MPSRAKIAYYWRDISYDYFGYIMDWGEPSCWACGRFNGSLDIELDELEDNELFIAWDKHNYLQRCHIVPRALGGCTCEANLILMCKDCHRESPDTKDPTYFMKWVRNRGRLWTKEIENAMNAIEYEVEQDDGILIISKEFKDYLKTNSVVVSGRLAWSSFFAALAEFKENLDSGRRKTIVEKFREDVSKQ